MFLTGKLMDLLFAIPFELVERVIQVVEINLYVKNSTVLGTINVHGKFINNDSYRKHINGLIQKDSLIIPFSNLSTLFNEVVGPAIDHKIPVVGEMK